MDARPVMEDCGHLAYRSDESTLFFACFIDSSELLTRGRTVQWIRVVIC